jgi:hypothetical protein
MKDILQTYMFAFFRKDRYICTEQLSFFNLILTIHCTFLGIFLEIYRYARTRVAEACLRLPSLLPLTCGLYWAVLIGNKT